MIMKELALFAEVEHSEELTAIPTIFEAGIWRYSLYATGGILPFMEDTFNRTPVNVSNIIIDNEEYIRFDTLELLREQLHADKGGWVNGGSVVYVRFPFCNPPYLHYSFKCGILMGFTNGSPLLKDGTMYKPGLLTSPRITHSADTFTYDRMKFNTANISIDNTNGQFDDARKFFGNEFNFKVGVVGKEEQPLKMSAQYYIENILVSLGKADFKLSDKRERLSAKIPNKQYTTGDYPNIDDNLVDKDMQEAYGRCFGVPGVCLEGKSIYVNGVGGEQIKQYRFRFSSQISRIDRIQVKMTNLTVGLQFMNFQ